MKFKVFAEVLLYSLFVSSVTGKDLQWKTVWEKSLLNDTLGGDKIYEVLDKDAHLLYCVSNGSYIEALNSENGKTIWLQQYKGELNENFKSPLYFNHRLYWGNVYGNYYCFDVKKQLSVFSIIKDSSRSICRSSFSGAINDSILVIGGIGKGYSSIIQALDWNSGVQKWCIKIKGCEISGKPAFDKKHIYFIAGEQIVATTFLGNIVWTFKGDYSNFDNNFPVATEKLLLYSSVTTVYALNKETGLCIWKKENIEKELSIPLFYNNKIFVIGGKGLIFCFDANTGKEIWKTTLPDGVIDANQPVVWNNSLLFIHCISHENTSFHLYFIDSESGSMLADKKLPDYEHFIEPIFVNNNRLFLQSKKSRPDNHDNYYVILRSVEIGLK